MMRLVSLLVAFCAVGILSADARSVRGAPYPGLVSVAGLHVSGKYILNGSGQVVPLRGVDKSGTEYECISSTTIFDGPSDSASVAVLQTWAVDIVRLPLNEDCWLGINGVTTGGTTYQTAIVNYTNLLTAAGIAVIIDLQWAAPGTTVANQLTPMPDFDHAPAFWTSVANTFKTNSSVLFDLFNEPYPDSNADTTAAWSCLLNGGNSATCPGSGLTWTNGAVGTQALVTAIRATGATNIIMVPGVQFTNTLTHWLANEPTDTLSPPQLVASWHSYSDQICAPQSCWTTNIQPVLNSVPLIAGEIGERDCGGVFIDPLMSWLDARNGNYLAWAWNTYDCFSFPAVISAFDGTPTGFGIEFRNHLLGLVGRTPPAPPVIPFFKNAVFPYGLALGKTGSSYTATDGTVYYPDVSATGLDVRIDNSAPNFYGLDFAAFTTGDTITGTSDPTLYQTGRQGCCGKWIINVPNGNYYVTLGMAPNTTYTTGQYGQDQYFQGSAVAACVWSNNPASGGGCGSVDPNPTVDVAQTVTYTVSIYNQQLTILIAASNGGGRTTMLNSIKIAQAP